MEDVAAMSSSVLRNLCVKLREDMLVNGAETHPRKVLERKACCILLVELAESNANGLLGVGPKHELKEKNKPKEVDN
jgi:hypothetical protein